MLLQVNFTKLNKSAVTPSYSREGDAGLDLVAISESWNEDNSMVTYDTGIAVEIPEGYVGLLFPRSSISKTNLILSNSVGIIDSNYRGPIMLKFRYPEEGYVYDVGDRVGQLVIIPYPTINLNLVDTLSDSNRGDKGFGSSGK